MLLVVVLFALYFYQKGKSKGDQKGIFDWLSGFQDEPEGDPRVINLNNNGECPEGWDPAPLSERLYNELDGFNMTYDDDLYREFANLPTDCMAAAVSNHFIENYGQGQSLLEWIENEMFKTTGMELAIQRLKLIGA